MAYKISTAKTYKFPVKVDGPTEKGWKPYSFVGEFKRLDPETKGELLKKLTEMTSREVVDRVFVGWSGVEGEDDKPLEVNADNRAVLLDQDFVEASIVKAWVESALAGPAKN